MYNFRYRVPDDLMRSIKALPDVAYARAKTAFHTQLQPDVKRNVGDLLAPYPGPVVTPFQFATAKSRRAYFATNGFGKGIPYVRSGALERAWSVGVIEQGDRVILSVFNRAPYSKYVYGPRQVPGHRRTGWGRDFSEGIELIKEDAIKTIINIWRDSVRYEVKAV